MSRAKSVFSCGFWRIFPFAVILMVRPQETPNILPRSLRHVPSEIFKDGEEFFLSIVFAQSLKDGGRQEIDSIPKLEESFSFCRKGLRAENIEPPERQCE